MMKFIFSTLLICNLCPALQAQVVLHFPMELQNRQIREEVSGQEFYVQGTDSPVPQSVDGARGQAMRFDGYSNYISAALPFENKSYAQMSFSLWCAPETYPVMTIDEATSEQTLIAGNIDDTEKSGFGFFIGRNGSYGFRLYSEGWEVMVEAQEPMPCYTWNHLVALFDGTTRSLKLYNNAREIASSRTMRTFSLGRQPVMIGKSAQERKSGLFHLNTFNGLIDDFFVSEGLIAMAEIQATPDAPACLNYPSARYADDLMRPRFHGMPSGNWTNESHGLVHHDGRYHLFFQKNGNGPFMTRLQWGHLESDDLLSWQERPIALYTDRDYDQKGCWSGTVFSDAELTGNKPHIFYTGVDYERAVIAEALPLDDDLSAWKKVANNPLVNGRPGGLSDDFRDPYIFRANDGSLFMIVGTSKNGLGATTLHRYNKTTRSWSNDGSIFFQATHSSQGTFWEMPTMTKMGDKWLFTVTPLRAAQGVEVLYWTGSLAPDGTFLADSPNPKPLELDGMSRHGYGMLSPSVLQHDGQTIALGIVPDKLDAKYNYQMGYAHTYSLPREWSLDAGGNLIQKPHSGLAKLRSAKRDVFAGTELNGSVAMEHVEGRMVEVVGRWTVDSSVARVGFNLLGNGTTALQLYYSPSDNTLSVDMRGISRWDNDQSVFNGLYRSVLPHSLPEGSEIKIHAFLGHSVLDVFVNDRWAFSVRVFCDDAAARKVEAFAQGNAHTLGIEAYELSMAGNATSVGGVTYKDAFSVGKDKVCVNGVGSLVAFSADGRLIGRCQGRQELHLPANYRGVVLLRYTEGGMTVSRKILR